MKLIRTNMAFKTDPYMLNIIKRLRESTQTESEFWAAALNFLRSHAKTVDVFDESSEWFSAKFTLMCLQSYGSDDIMKAIHILKNYANVCELSLTDLDFSNVCFLELHLCDLHEEIQYYLSSGFTDNIIYYSDELTRPNSMHLALELADSCFSVCLIKYSLFSRMKIRYLELRAILSSFLRIW